MQFQFRPIGRRELPDDVFLADIRRVAEMLRKPTLSVTEYQKHGKYRAGTFRRFGHWAIATEKAGLERSRQYGVSSDQLLADIRLVARRLNTDCMLLKQYTEAGKYSGSCVARLFGRWHIAACAAGITSPAKYRSKTVVELMENLEKVWTSLGRQPRTTEMIPPLSQCGVGSYQKCFGSWQKALGAFSATWAPKDKMARARLNEIVPVHKTPRNLNARLKFYVLKRDHFRCRARGRSPATDPLVELHVDHINPWCRGGETVVDNLQTLCQACNSGKGDMVM